MPDLAQGYVDDLLGDLRVSRSHRRRIAEEVKAHLEELAADESVSGVPDAEAAGRAVARFGSPHSLAAEFNADAARRSLGRASWLLVACLAVAFLAARIALLGGGAPSRPWPCPLLFYGPVQILISVGIVCGVNGLFLAVLAPRLLGRPLTGRPARLAGRSLATASVVLLPVAVVALGNLGSSVPTAERIPLALVALGTPLAAYRGMRASGRASWLATADGKESTLDVIVGVTSALGRARPGFYRPFAVIWRSAYLRAPWLMRWVDFRNHPWHAAATASVMAGVFPGIPAVIAGQLDLLPAIVRATAVFACYAGLGGLLGLRGSARPNADHEPDPEAGRLFIT